MKCYSEDHEWVELVGDVATLGISAHAASELGDITFIELPAVGKGFKKGDVLCVVESVKAASDVFVPVTGTVSEVNGELEGEPGRINADAEGAGWICRIKGVNAAELTGLMSAAQYQAFLAK